ncbi:phosphoenolpyruvate-protein phosphotransferase [Solidesulfovibrio fructosivorans JJ]]|uniref:phosphoenolpyruvate--protein phosphotransferase n=1 Tax=Solidesulfovibrio fructosivorans JJ] TaxID=596151 RepID=E1JSY9_SOLFR|nr:phosphoenolpyruvate--protein phosphotransferase [Solidesulfovibrio fructosivorans]EFL52622.1 phosphoenolpyruvate-protein phosphotransferase [Solidesulfovibrio fructosivorans JJ]]
MIDFDKRSVLLGARVAGKHEAIEQVAGLLASCGNIDPGYAQSMLRRESVANTFLGNGIAIPHGLPQDRALIRKTGIAVLQTPEGVAWNPGETVYLVVGIAASSDEHIPILTNLTHVLDDPEIADRLAVTRDPEEIVAALRGELALREKPAPALDLSGYDQSLVVTVAGEHGLHARPATFFVDVAKTYDADILVEYDGRAANGRSLASLLKLGVTTGRQIRLHAKGPQSQAALAALKNAVDAGLGEERGEPGAAPSSGSGHGFVPTTDAHAILGVAASPGLAIGPVKQHVHSRIIVEATAKDPQRELTALRQALVAAQENLHNLYEEVRARSGLQKAAIFHAHEAFLDDPELLAEVEAGIRQGKSAGFAWRQVIDSRVAALERHDDPVLAGRAMDLRDVGRRVLRHLAGVVHDDFVLPDTPVILVAEDLTPSDTAMLDPARILGFCTAAGGPTSHSAIIARSLGIPAMVGAGPALLAVADGVQAILDGDGGALYLDPGQEDLAAATQARRKMSDVRDEEHAARFQPALMRDGTRVEVVANIGKVNEAGQAVEAGAEGVGLMRTEFLFLGRETPPDEEEQFQSYKAMVEALAGLPIIIRTLDIGGDKAVPYLDLPHEDNPFLGERGIRLCLNRPELFLSQLRAVYRASAAGPVRIMFPMIATLEDLAAAKRLAEKARIEVGAAPVPIGIMVEVPSVALMAPEFAREVDFFSVGTNDLTQYVMAIDRLHPSLAAKADSLHPAILRLIRQVVDAAEAAGKWVGVCGGLAGEPLGAVILAGLGVRELSMVVPSIAAIKAKMRTIRMDDARALAKKALACRDVKDVRALPLP